MLNIHEYTTYQTENYNIQELTATIAIRNLIPATISQKPRPCVLVGVFTEAKMISSGFVTSKHQTFDQVLPLPCFTFL